MRIQPVKRYRPPALPLAAWSQADPAEHAPRCGRLLRLLAGAGLLGTGAFAPFAHGADAGGTVVPTPEAAPDPGETPSAAAPAPASDAALFRIAPNLLETMRSEGLGRGTIGCVAFDPPSFITEEDGVAIIRAELEKAGMALAYKGPTVPAVLQPQTTTIDPISQEDAERLSLTFWPSAPADYQDSPTPFEFDGASLDRRVVFEFVSKQDFELWEAKGKTMWSSMETYDLISATERLAGSLARTPSQTRQIVFLVCDPVIWHGKYSRDGLDEQRKRLQRLPEEKDFFDLSAYYEAERKKDEGAIGEEEFQAVEEKFKKGYADFERAQKESMAAWNAYHDEVGRRRREAAVAEIRRQLAPQIEFLRQEGLLPPAAPAPAE